MRVIESSTANQAIGLEQEAKRPLALIFCLRLVLWAFIAFTLGKHGIYRPLTSFGVDYQKHWYAARAVLEGKSNYDVENFWLWLGFNYPQWSALITFWLAYFDIETAEIVWKMMGRGLVIACWWIGRGCFDPGPATPAEQNLSPLRRSVASAIRSDWPLACAFMIAAFAPAGSSSLFLGQIEPMNAFLMMAFAAAVLLGNDRLSGVYWAMLCLIKMIPVFLIVPILFWRRWRILQTWFLFMAGYGVVLIVTGRVKYEWFFVTEMAHLLPFHWRGISAAIPRAVLLVFFPSDWRDDPVHYMRVMNAGLIVLGVLYVWAIAAIRRAGWSFERALEVGILFIPLLSPVLENHHLAWTLPVFFFHVRRWVRGEMSTAMAVVLALGWWFIMLDLFAHNMLEPYGEWTKFICMSGAVLIVVASMIELFRARPVTTSLRPTPVRV